MILANSSHKCQHRALLSRLLFWLRLFMFIFNSFLLFLSFSSSSRIVWFRVERLIVTSPLF
nr:MAG TPA: hypothetical protein [Caudoviricetes sp.]